jgi:hypothetical protein
MSERRWSLASARGFLPEIRRRTEAAVARMEEVGISEGSNTEQQEAAAAAILEQWARDMEALGVEVKGPWLVDFDTGAGYYCWRWPEEELAYFHAYDEGFDSRTRIQ